MKKKKLENWNRDLQQALTQSMQIQQIKKKKQLKNERK